MRTAIVSCFEYDMIMVNIQKALENQVLMGKSTISTGPWLQKKADGPWRIPREGRLVGAPPLGLGKPEELPSKPRGW